MKLLHNILAPTSPSDFSPHGVDAWTLQIKQKNVSKLGEEGKENKKTHKALSRPLKIFEVKVLF